MAKAQAHYVCQQCGASTQKWSGRCEACGEWNSIVEEASAAAAPKGLGRGKGRSIELAGMNGPANENRRTASGIAEFDRVCGGGLVPGVCGGGHGSLRDSGRSTHAAAGQGTSRPLRNSGAAEIEGGTSPMSDRRSFLAAC